MASFLLDWPNGVRRDLKVFDEPGTKHWGTFFFAQDKWQARSNVTIDLGGRWEYYTPLEGLAGTGSLANYDPAIHSIRVAGYGDTDNAVNVKKNFGNFVARTGVSWRLSEISVVRAGYGASDKPPRGYDGAVICRTFLVDLLNPQGCLAHRRLLDATTELHEQTLPAIASLVEYVFELDAGTYRDCERASTRGEPALDVRERRIPFEAKHAVEEEHPRVGANRKRRRIVQVEHPKFERVRHVGRCSREEVEHGRQLDPLEVVHATSLPPAAVRATLRGVERAGIEPAR